MKKGIRNLFILITGIVFLAGCGIYTHKGYSGWSRPDDEIAIIKTDNDYAIGKVDDEETYIESRTWFVPFFGKTKATVPPGEHVLRASYVGQGWIGGWCYMKVRVEAGKTYRVKGRLYDLQSEEGNGGFVAKKGPKTVKIKTWVEDTASGEHVSYDLICSDRNP